MFKKIKNPKVKNSKSKKDKNKKVRSNREDSNFLLGCFKIKKEDHAELEKSLCELNSIFENLNEISLDNETYQIEYFIGGDLKFIALVLGINGAQSLHPCPWCESHKSTFAKNIHKHNPNRVIQGSKLTRNKI